MSVSRLEEVTVGYGAVRRGGGGEAACREEEVADCGVACQGGGDGAAHWVEVAARWRERMQRRWWHREEERPIGAARNRAQRR